MGFKTAEEKGMEEPVTEEEAETQDKWLSVRLTRSKRQREHKEELECQTSLRRSREASLSSVEGRIEPSDPRANTGKDDCDAGGVAPT